MQNYDELVSAKLFSYTTLNPYYGVELNGMEELVAYAAKVSNPDSATQANMDTAEKLIKYLIANAHWSPLEMVDATIEFETTRDISHQIVRHRSFSFQEFSQRYAETLTEDDNAIRFVLSEARRQDAKNRQSSIELDPNVFDDRMLADWWKTKQELITKIAEQAYKEAIKKGLAKEVARKILPEGLTTTRGFMKGSIRSWLHYLELRTGNGTQKEHMILAQEIAKVITLAFPMTKDFTNV